MQLHGVLRYPWAEHVVLNLLVNEDEHENDQSVDGVFQQRHQKRQHRCDVSAHDWNELREEAGKHRKRQRKGNPDYTQEDVKGNPVDDSQQQSRIEVRSDLSMAISQVVKTSRCLRGESSEQMERLTRGPSATK